MQILAAKRTNSGTLTLTAGTSNAADLDLVTLDTANFAVSALKFTAPFSGLYKLDLSTSLSYTGVGTYDIDMYSSVRGRLYYDPVQQLVLGEEISVFYVVTGVLTVTILAGRINLSIYRIGATS